VHISICINGTGQRPTFFENTHAKVSIFPLEVADIPQTLHRSSQNYFAVHIRASHEHLTICSKLGGVASADLT